jgi:hypothetical protein
MPECILVCPNGVGTIVSTLGFDSPKPTCLVTHNKPLGVTAHCANLATSKADLSTAAAIPPLISPSSANEEPPHLCGDLLPFL